MAYIPKPTELNDWLINLELSRECCLSAQSNGADVLAKSVLSIVGQMLEQALAAKNRFLYLSFAPLAVAPSGISLSPVITGFPAIPLPSAIPVGAVLLAVGAELGNVYGRTVLLNAFSDMTSAVTESLTQAQLEIRKPSTGRKTRRGIFDCDKCVREKALPQHGTSITASGPPVRVKRGGARPQAQQ